MTVPASPDGVPVDGLNATEMAALLRWAPWMMSGADSLLVIAQEIDTLGLAVGGNPVSRLDQLAVLFDGMAEDLARAARSMQAVAADRRARVAGSN